MVKEGGEYLVQESAFVWGTEPGGSVRTADAEKTIPTSHPTSPLTEKQQTTLHKEKSGGREADQLLANIAA